MIAAEPIRRDRRGRVWIKPRPVEETQWVCTSARFVEDTQRAIDSLCADELVLWHGLFGEYPRMSRRTRVEALTAMRRGEEEMVGRVFSMKRGAA